MDVAQKSHTPLKSKIATQNSHVLKGDTSSKPSFLVSMLVFGGVTFPVFRWTCVACICPLEPWQWPLIRSLRRWKNWDHLENHGPIEGWVGWVGWWSILYKWVFPKIGVFPPNHPLKWGFSILNHPFLGYPYFLETPKWSVLCWDVICEWFMWVWIFEKISPIPLTMTFGGVVLNC